MRFKEKTGLREGFLGWGDLNRFVSRKKKGGSYGESKLKIKGVMGVKFFQKAGKDPECK